MYDIWGGGGGVGVQGGQIQSVSTRLRVNIR